MNTRVCIGLTIVLVLLFAFQVYHFKYEHENVLQTENKAFVENIELKMQADSLQDLIARQDSNIQSLKTQSHENNIIYIEKIASIRALPADSSIKLLSATLIQIDSLLRRQYGIDHRTGGQ